MAPAATLTLSAIWIWSRRKILEYLEERDAEKYFEAARKAINDALQNPTLSPEDRAEFEKSRLELDRLIVERKMAMATHHARK